MNALVLKPQAKQLFEVQPQNSHPKLSLRRVLWVRFLRWIDKASPELITKTLLRAASLLLMGSAIFLPSFLVGVASSVIQWNGFKIPIFLGLLAFMLNARRLFSALRRRSIRKRTGNQHTYHGLPVGELAAFLKQQASFKRDEAIKTFALSQGQYQKIAQELEEHGILMRGENNARVLREISMENLVLQLREDFPLVWSEERQVWAERNGAFERWALSQDFARRKMKETTERRERKLERLDREIDERASMADVLALCQ